MLGGGKGPTGDSAACMHGTDVRRAQLGPAEVAGHVAAPAHAAAAECQSGPEGIIDLTAVDVSEQQRMLSHIQAAAKMNVCKPQATKQTSLRSLFMFGQRRNSV